MPRDQRQWIKALEALGWELSPEDIYRLTKEFQGQKTTSDRVPLDYAADIPA